jgi:hypothetical protein
MAEIILETKELPKILNELIKTNTVRMYQTNETITLVPNDDTNSYMYNCRFFGMFKSDTSVVDEVIAARRKDPRG